jgi:hypothetical protein
MRNSDAPAETREAEEDWFTARAGKMERVTLADVESQFDM